MKTKLFIFFAAFLLSAATGAKKRAITFNVMTPGGEVQKQLEKAMKEEPGVQKFKLNKKDGTAEVTFEDAVTSLKTVTAVFRKNGCTAFPIGENCSKKKGGCLNNPPTQMNTLE